MLHAEICWLPYIDYALLPVYTKVTYFSEKGSCKNVIIILLC